MFSKVVVALALLGSASAKFYSNNTEHMTYAFRQFVAEHNRHYPTMKEELKAYNTFVENMKVVDERNAKEIAAGGSPVHGVTKFADMSQADFEARYLTSKPSMKSGKAKV